MANSKRKCRHCGNYRDHHTGIIVPLGFFCSDDCRYQYGMKNSQKLSQKAAQKRVKEFNQETAQMKKELNKTDLRWQHKQTQPAFNKMRVLQEKLWFQERGLEPECISCGCKNMDWSCGHLKTVGANRGLRYDTKNTFLQCFFKCNKNRSGNINGNRTERGFLNGLRERFGLEEGQAIIDYCETNNSPVKWTCEQLEEMRKGFNEKIRELNKALQ